MKKAIIKDYIQGLASFLDEQGIKWEYIGSGIIIYYESTDQLFLIGFKFGKFYMHQ